MPRQGLPEEYNNNTTTTWPPCHEPLSCRKCTAVSTRNPLCTPIIAPEAPGIASFNISHFLDRLVISLTWIPRRDGEPDQSLCSRFQSIDYATSRSPPIASTCEISRGSTIKIDAVAPNSIVVAVRYLCNRWLSLFSESNQRGYQL